MGRLDDIDTDDDLPPTSTSHHSPVSAPPPVIISLPPPPQQQSSYSSPAAHVPSSPTPVKPIQVKGAVVSGKVVVGGSGGSASNGGQVFSGRVFKATAVNASPAPTSAPVPSPAPSSAPKSVDLDDLFGGFTTASSSKAASPPPPKPANDDDIFGAFTSSPSSTNHSSPTTNVWNAPPPTQTQAVAGNKGNSDAFDALFSSGPEPKATAQGSPNQSHPGYAAQGAYAAENEDNLFDFSKPAQRATYKDEESFLEGFEMQGKKKFRSSNEPTLSSMSSGMTTNRMKAQLLALMNYYDVLGVAPTASPEEIRRQYKKKALELHPDKVGRDQTAEEAELFKTITKAHEVLIDPEQRATYDATLSAGQNAPSANNWFAHLSSNGA